MDSLNYYKEIIEKIRSAVPENTVSTNTMNSITNLLNDDKFTKILEEQMDDPDFRKEMFKKGLAVQKELFNNMIIETDEKDNVVFKIKNLDSDNSNDANTIKHLQSNNNGDTNNEVKTKIMEGMKQYFDILSDETHVENINKQLTKESILSNAYKELDDCSKLLNNDSFEIGTNGDLSFKFAINKN